MDPDAAARVPFDNFSINGNIGGPGGPMALAQVEGDHAGLDCLGNLDPVDHGGWYLPSLFGKKFLDLSSNLIPHFPEGGEPLFFAAGNFRWVRVTLRKK